MINLNRKRQDVEKDIIKKYKNCDNKELIIKLCNTSFNPKTMKKSLETIDRIIKRTTENLIMDKIKVKDLDIEEIFLEENINENEVLDLDFTKESFKNFDDKHSVKLCVIYPFNGTNVTFTELGVGEVGVGGENRIYINSDCEVDVYDYSIIFDKEECLIC